MRRVNIDIMVKCPHCELDKRQSKNGKTRFGSQRYFCPACQRGHTPHPKQQGCPAQLRQEAVRYCLEGLSQRKVARLLRVAPQSVANWLAQAAAQLEEKQIPCVPPELAARCDGVMEQDELYTFCNAKRAKKSKQTGEKKTKSTLPVGSMSPPL